MAHTVRRREEVPKQFTWNTESIFGSEEAWTAAFEKALGEIDSAGQYRGTLGGSPERLLEFFGVEEALAAEISKIYIFAHTTHDVDTADGAAKERMDKARGLVARTMAALSFAEPEILAIGRETLDGWMQQNADLRLYSHYFDVLFARQEHVRTPDVEEVLGLVRDPFSAASSIHGVLSDTDLTFEPARTSGGEAIEIAQGNIGALLTDTDREVRRTAWENYADSYLAYKNTMAAALAAGTKQHVFFARARRYDSVLEAALSPNHIPVEVFHNLISVFRRNLPIWHRYWAIRKEALGLDEFHPYDIKAPLVTNPPDVSWDQAVSWIVEGMAPLGEEYVTILRNGVTRDRWVDVYPNVGKRSGAYSTGSQGTMPLILMSFNDDIYGMSTLAHELGHSLHSYLTWQTQPHVYSDYSLFVAEVASNFNQALVRAHLLDTNSDRDFQISVIEEAMSNFHRYFFIMPTLARFELEIHERSWRGEGLTADGMIDLMADLFAEGYGEGVTDDRQRTGSTWAQFPTHLYANFYVYQYATGISAAHTLAAGVLEGKPGAAENYLSFLKAGGSLYPLDALKLAGVDMTSTEPVERGFDEMGQLVDRLGDLLGVSKGQAV
jgi:oligoendopeptidase F